VHNGYIPGSLLPAHISARTALGRMSLFRVGVVLAVVVVSAIGWPTFVLPLMTTLIALMYLLATLDRNWMIIKGLRTPAMVTITDSEALAVPEDDLPAYTVLLPVYDEPSIVENLLNGVAKLNYPSDKLEILLLVEEDDVATQAALIGLPLDTIRVVIVPDSMPKTKPKACNYGMSMPDIRGELVTIYDAEDIPDPLQLRKAVVAFRLAPKDIGCLQCRLGYFNESQNLLTRWFALEYATWFSVVLPAAEASGSVVPLGGTSGHMPTRIWREVGGWDEFNVTEDADLGVRLARHGYRTQILDSLTLEEANSDVVNWIRQRSRWYKGYLQTMIVHLRHPLRLRREIGTKAVLRLINMTGAIPVVNVLNIVFTVVLLAWVAGRPAVIVLLFPGLTYYVYLVLFLVGGPLSIYLALVLAQTLGKPYLWWAALLSPMYWVLQSVAAVKAIYQLFFRPFFWEKTVHGLSSVHTAPIVQSEQA
jgi:glycosyltransferase XagB